ncbi:hypothetical protein [Acidimangrovimonas sediminis]|uniref:hypothetical protein n=1 Tax=Acidimangrovimonas sediminis TaxID=2056283 RepID=UPI000C806210|nr:hypothetical protein [Acidimangrovimonas sediminis]
MTHISPLLRAAEQTATTQGAVAREPAGPHVSYSPLRAGWRWLIGQIRTFEDSHTANWVGGAALAVMLISGIWIAAGFGWTDVLP